MTPTVNYKTAEIQQGLGLARLRGDRLRAAREQAGFTQEEMATEIGISVSEYGRWERNKLKKIPPADQVLIACTKLQIGVRYVMDIREEPSVPWHLTPDEVEVVEGYRALKTPEEKTTARRRLQALRSGEGIGDVVPFRRRRE